MFACVFTGGELEMSETHSAGGEGGGEGDIDLISCARHPIEVCRFSRF